MIVSCPSCGTSYKHPAVALRARARCGCCAGAIDLTGLRPYRLERVATPSVSGDARVTHLSVGFDEPALAAQIAVRAGRAEPAPLVPLIEARETWDETESLPEIPEMSGAAEEFERPADPGDEAEMALEASEPSGASPMAVFGFWAVGGAIVGTGTSWTLGGTTAAGLAAGGLTGLAAAWGWLRWTSRA